MASTHYGAGGALLPRPDLEARLATLVEHPVTLVWGAAGSGKHTLLEAVLRRLEIPIWVARLGNSAKERQAADLSRFRIIASPDLGIPQEMSEFVDSWRQNPRPGALLLEGCPLTVQEWKGTIPPGFFESLPQGLRTILVARVRPGLPLERLFLSGRLLEIGPEALHADLRETRGLLVANGITALPAEAPEAIFAATRGWIAGILLCALHVRSSPDPVAALKTLAENPHLLEFLSQEILEAMPASKRQGILDLSVIRAHGVDLRESVLERGATEAGFLDLVQGVPLFRQTESGDMFAIPLVRDGLERILHRCDPHRRSALHRRAARWHLGHGEPQAAFRHAMDALDPEILETVAEAVLRNLFRNSDFPALQRHAGDLPPALAKDRPFLSLFLAWALFHMGREHEGAEHLERTRELAAHAGPARRESILAHEAFLRSILVRLEGRMDDSASVARAGLEACGEGRPFLAASLLVQSGVSQFLFGDLDRAGFDLAEAMDRALESGHHLAYFGAGYTRCEIHILRGRLDLAHELLIGQRNLSRTETGRLRPVSGYLEIADSRLNLVQGNLAAACESVERGIQLGRECDNIRILNYGLAARAEIAAQAGDLDGAARALDEAVVVSRRTRMHWAVDLDDLEARRIRLLLRRLPDSILQSWLSRNLPRLGEPHLPSADAFRTALRLLVCVGRVEEAVRLGSAWRSFFRKSGLFLPLVEVEYGLALACGFRGRTGLAAEHLDAALGLAATRGIAGPFLHGPELDGIRLDVFAAWRSRDVETDPAKTALADRLAPRSPTTRERAAVPSGASQLGSLSERESQVLRALREGRSNKEIADLLFVAESTVKTHLKNIFGKLGVDNRTRAAALALESGFVGKSPVRGRREEGRGP